MNLEVSSFLNLSSYVTLENSLLPNDFIVIRNMGEDQEKVGEGLGGVREDQDVTSGVGDLIQVGIHADSESRSSPH